MSGVGFLFPGQGAQFPGMGRELAETYPESRAVFDEADRALGTSIRRICFEGSEEELALTENTQPAILTVSIAALRALSARGVRARAAAGHSLGEYSAHVAAGTVDFTSAVRTVRSRGRFMQEAVPVGVGAMAAILGLEREPVERICRDVADAEVVAPANLNGPGQIVIAGHRDAVERAGIRAREEGATRVVPLAVSAPFHCALMQPAADRLRPELDRLDFKDPRLPVFTNVDAAPVQGAVASRDALVRQVASPVRWHELIENMIDSGIDTFVEIGPGKVLSGLTRRIRRGTRVISVSDPAAVEKTAQELAAA